tara:strand:- start:2580 stop:3866 length:1287 start_codon:yes stop_codon:yes gene_type:complete
MSKNYNLSISPANHLANATVSYRNGNPVVRFEIGESNRVLLPSSLRLVGSYHVYSDAARSVPVEATALETPSNLGVYATLDSLSFRTQRSKSEIETISGYNRFMSTYLPATTSLQDGIGHLGESALVAPNPQFNKETVVNNASTTTGNSFCIPLISGFTSSNNPYPLYNQGVEVTLQMSPDSQVMFSTGTDSSAFVNGFYEFKDLKLICEVVDTGESPDPSAPLTYEYNSITTFYNTINSTNAQISLNLGQSRVLGVFGSFVPTSFINNLTQNGLATLYPRKSATEAAAIEQIVFTRGGERFPLIYNLDTLQKTTPTDESADPQVVRNFMNAVVEFSKLNRTNASPVNTFVETDGTYGYKETIQGGSAGAGIGCAMDVISGQGVDFSRVPFGIQMELDLDLDFPNALYLYIHAKNTLVMSGDSIQVLH